MDKASVPEPGRRWATMGDMDAHEIETLLADLDRRVRHAEDVIALQQLVAEYGPSVDGGATPAAVVHWTDDGTYGFGTGPGEQVAGRDALTELFDGPGHQGIIAGGSAHIVTPPALRIDGDDAWGTGYSILFRFDGEVPGPQGGDADEGWRAARVSSVRWTFRRVEGRWHTVDRTNQLLTGSDAARALFSTSFSGDRFAPENPLP